MNNKEVKDLIKEYRLRGWRVDMTRKNHYRFRGPNGELSIVGSTISDHRGLDAARAKLKEKAGEGKPSRPWRN